MIDIEMTREQKIKKLLKYKNKSDGIIYAPSGMTLNNWWNINSKYKTPKLIQDVVIEIEEEINEEKFNK